MDLIASTQSPDISTTGYLSFSYSNLAPFESRAIQLTFNLNGPADNPSVNIDDELVFQAFVTTNGPEETTFDNNFIFIPTVTGSFDPNDKQCLQGATVSPTQIGEYLHYVINFENTGNAAAQNIVLADEIDPAKFAISTLQVLHTSHPADVRITNNKIEFIFEGIMLEPDQRGNVVFKVKTNSTLVTGDTATNQANIFFDYNFPIETNLASTTFQTLTVGENLVAGIVHVYPNPTNGIINIGSVAVINSIELYDLSGRLLKVQKAEALETSIDIHGYPKAMYFMKVRTDAGVSIEKIIRN
jgi:hypothetical protein